MNGFCDFCGKEIGVKNGRGRPSRFCTSKCAVKYHNELKRSERQKPLLEAEILRHRDNLMRGGELPNLSLDLLQKLLSLASYQVDISCSACGQKRFDFPTKKEICAFCGGNEWRFRPKTSK